MELGVNALLCKYLYFKESLNWYFIFSLLWSTVLASDLLVESTLGMIEGTYFKTVSGRVISAFLGIPYAQPPIDDNRLREPKLHMGWPHPLIHAAKTFGPSCKQFTVEESEKSLDEFLISGQEDCLHLNIFTPAASKSSNLHVLFFIHGGGFMKGSSNMYTPDFIMDRHNIVFVTINYRLGPLGFLSTEDEVIPGNFGLKDQLLALKWIRDNIDNFGGDKDKITLMGEDAGAASVHLHYLSPLSRHLFKQGISLGGSAFCPWALTEDSYLKTLQFVKLLNCPNTTSHALLDCLETISHYKLLHTLTDLFVKWKLMPFSPFAPVIEKQTDTAFLYDHPHKIIEERKFKDAPWLVGLTSHEGLYPGAKFARNHDFLEELDENWHDIAPHLLDYNHTVPSDMLHSVNEKIRQFYFDDKEISVKMRREFIAMLSDRLYVADTERAIRLQASVSKSYVFLYKFGYRGKHSKAYSLCNCKENEGASHGDDLLYLFKHKGLDVTEFKFGEAMMRKMVDILISFLEKGYPRVDKDTVWKPVKREAVAGHNIHYMNILTSQSMDLEHSPDLGNRRFWSNLHLAELKNVVGEHKRLFDEL